MADDLITGLTKPQQAVISRSIGAALRRRFSGYKNAADLHARWPAPKLTKTELYLLIHQPIDALRSNQNLFLSLPDLLSTPADEIYGEILAGKYHALKNGDDSLPEEETETLPEDNSEQGPNSSALFDLCAALTDNVNALNGSANDDSRKTAIKEYCDTINRLILSDSKQISWGALGDIAPLLVSGRLDDSAAHVITTFGNLAGDLLESGTKPNPDLLKKLIKVWERLMAGEGIGREKYFSNFAPNIVKEFENKGIPLTADQSLDEEEELLTDDEVETAAAPAATAAVRAPHKSDDDLLTMFGNAVAESTKKVIGGLVPQLAGLIQEAINAKLPELADMVAARLRSGQPDLAAAVAATPAPAPAQAVSAETAPPPAPLQPISGEPAPPPASDDADAGEEIQKVSPQPTAPSAREAATSVSKTQLFWTPPLYREILDLREAGHKGPAIAKIMTEKYGRLITAQNIYGRFNLLNDGKAEAAPPGSIPPVAPALVEPAQPTEPEVREAEIAEAAERSAAPELPAAPEQRPEPDYSPDARPAAAVSKHGFWTGARLREIITLNEVEKIDLPEIAARMTRKYHHPLKGADIAIAFHHMRQGILIPEPVEADIQPQPQQPAVTETPPPIEAEAETLAATEPETAVQTPTASEIVAHATQVPRILRESVFLRECLPELFDILERQRQPILTRDDFARHLVSRHRYSTNQASHIAISLAEGSIFREHTDTVTVKEEFLDAIEFFGLDPDTVFTKAIAFEDNRKFEAAQAAAEKGPIGVVRTLRDSEFLNEYMPDLLTVLEQRDPPILTHGDFVRYIVDTYHTDPSEAYRTVGSLAEGTIFDLSQPGIVVRPKTVRIVESLGLSSEIFAKVIAAMFAKANAAEELNRDAAAPPADESAEGEAVDAAEDKILVEPETPPEAEPEVEIIDEQPVAAAPAPVAMPEMPRDEFWTDERLREIVDMRENQGLGYPEIAFHMTEKYNHRVTSPGVIQRLTFISMGGLVPASSGTPAPEHEAQSLPAPAAAPVATPVAPPAAAPTPQNAGGSFWTAFVHREIVDLRDEGKKTPEIAAILAEKYQRPINADDIRARLQKIRDGRAEVAPAATPATLTPARQVPNAPASFWTAAIDQDMLTLFTEERLTPLEISNRLLEQHDQLVGETEIMQRINLLRPNEANISPFVAAQTEWVESNLEAELRAAELAAAAAPEGQPIGRVTNEFWNGKTWREILDWRGEGMNALEIKRQIYENYNLHVKTKEVKRQLNRLDQGYVTANPPATTAEIALPQGLTQATAAPVAEAAPEPEMPEATPEAPEILEEDGEEELLIDKDDEELLSAEENAAVAAARAAAQPAYSDRPEDQPFLPLLTRNGFESFEHLAYASQKPVHLRASGQEFVKLWAHIKNHYPQTELFNLYHDEHNHSPYRPPPLPEHLRKARPASPMPAIATPAPVTSQPAPTRPSMPAPTVAMAAAARMAGQSGAPSRALNSYPFFRTEVPELTAALYVKNIRTRADLLRALLAKGMNPANAQGQLHNFCEGNPLNRLKRDVAFTIIAGYVADIAGIAAEVAYAKQIAAHKAANPEKPASEGRTSRSLDSYPLFVDDMPALLEALQGKGIYMRSALVKEFVKKGVPPASAENYCMRFCEGTVLDTRSGNRGYTNAAKMTADIAGIAPEIAYAKQIAAYEERRATAATVMTGIGPAARSMFTRTASRNTGYNFGNSRPLTDYPLFTVELPEVLEGLRAKNIRTRSGLLSALADKGLPESNANTQLTAFCEGAILNKNATTIKFNRISELIAEIAGLTTEQAYARQIAGVKPATNGHDQPNGASHVEENFGAAAGDTGTRAPAMPANGKALRLENYPFAREHLYPLIEAAKDKSIHTVEDVAVRLNFTGFGRYISDIDGLLDGRVEIFENSSILPAFTATPAAAAIACAAGLHPQAAYESVPVNRRMRDLRYAGSIFNSVVIDKEQLFAQLCATYPPLQAAGSLDGLYAKAKDLWSDHPTFDRELKDLADTKEPYDVFRRRLKPVAKILEMALPDASLFAGRAPPPSQLREIVGFSGLLKQFSQTTVTVNFRAKIDSMLRERGRKAYLDYLSDYAALFEGRQSPVENGRLNKYAVHLMDLLSIPSLRMVMAVPELSGNLIYSDLVRTSFPNLAHVMRFNDVYTLTALKALEGGKSITPATERNLLAEINKTDEAILRYSSASTSLADAFEVPKGSLLSDERMRMPGEAVRSQLSTKPRPDAVVPRQ